MTTKKKRGLIKIPFFRRVTLRKSKSPQKPKMGKGQPSPSPSPSPSQPDLSASPSFDENEFFAAFSHPIRRKIIYSLGIQANQGFSEIQKFTQVSTGAIYHHFDAMSECITQNSNKKYSLTPLGIKVFHFLQQSQQFDPTAENDSTSIDFRAKIRASLKVFLWRPIIESLDSNPPKFWILSQGIILLLGVFAALFDFQVFLFFYSFDTPFWVQWILNPWLSRFLSFISVFIGFYTSFLVIELICRWIFNRSDNGVKLWSKLGIAYLPFVIYLLFLGIMKVLGWDQSLFWNGFKFLSIAFQVWALLLLAEILTVEKGIKYEQSLILALILQYGTLILILLSNFSIDSIF